MACAIRIARAHIGHKGAIATSGNAVNASMPCTIRLAVLLCAVVLAGTCTGAPAASGTANLGTDDGGRYTTQVMLNGQGPFDFIVDTGAQASLLVAKTATRLKLQAQGIAKVIGANGGASSGIVVLNDFRSDVFDRHRELMVLIPNSTVTNADGVIGMNAFTSGRIEFGFARRTLQAGPSGPTPAGFLAQHGGVRQRSFLVVDAVIDGVHAQAVIDTGARRTVGNPQLLAALGFKPGDAQLLATESIGGATPQKTPASKAVLGSIAIGAAVLAKPTLTFADLPVFHSLGLDDGPALIVGVDAFSRLQAMAIDYPREELQLRQ